MRTKHVAFLALILLLPWLSACTESEAWMSPVLLGGGVTAGGGCGTNFGDESATGYTASCVTYMNSTYYVWSGGTCDMNTACFFGSMASGSGSAKIAVYADSAGNPTGSPLAISNVITVDSDVGQVWCGSLTSTWEITDGTYHLGALSEGGVAFTKDATSSMSDYKAFTWPNPPDPYVAKDGTIDGILQIHLEYN